MILNKAILILGPTGSGKTPLGALLEKKGVGGRKCYHFDFGKNLRAISKTKNADNKFTAEEIDFINKVLASGALLGNEHFYLAWKILDRFIERNHIGADELIILNGLPRHLDQARDIASILDIKTVIHLICTPEVVRARIRSNSGGDRTGRTDDNATSVQNKIALFNQRTVGLLEYYHSAGAKIIGVSVTKNTQPEDILNIFNAR
ncbi:MAG: nucleoside monophosphate kinase [Planctomycetes bacterium]|nr:nucleoside monophosphate kinase [Planctomycetota bacterium]